MTNIKFISLRLITACIIIAFIVTFTSCSKKDLKSSVAQVENSALTNDATIVMPEATGIATTESAHKNSSSKYNTFYGPQVQMGNGHARSWINITHDGKPLAIGVEMTDGALDHLPQNPLNFAAATWVLPLHQKAQSVTPFDHITINWNIRGHEPEHVYDVPHFDFHFYKISVDAQMSIPPYDVVSAGFDNEPPAGYMPPLYLHTPGGVPQMGAHWVDLLAPELNGGTFTSTFIYGSYNGHVTFEEPMITLTTLQSGNSIHLDFRQPDHFDPAGTNYPTRYNIWQNPTNSHHYVSLDNMVWR